MQNTLSAIYDCTRSGESRRLLLLEARARADDALVLHNSNHLPLRPSSAASWTRLQLATSLRTRKPYSVNLLLGGFDPTNNAPELYWIDYLGTLGVVPYAAHGYGAYFALSTMDRWHKPDMNLEEGMELLRKCVDELEKRFIVNLGEFTVRGTCRFSSRSSVLLARVARRAVFRCAES